MNNVKEKKDDQKVPEALRGPAVSQKVSRNVNKLSDEKLNLGQRAADALAKQAGSWKFIFSFAVILVLWMFVNSIAFFVRNWDP